jgi:AcrR family transcriptional regulator
MSTEVSDIHWLERVESLFLRFGIKSQTMDDVARELGISKKTLYQMVTNKDDLVQKVLEHHITREQSDCLAAAAAATNAIEEILIVTEANTQELVQMKTNVLYDLQKYHPRGWLLIRGFHFEFLYQMVSANIERGRIEGLYRKDFDIDVITKLHLASIFQLFDEEMFPVTTISKAELFREYMMHYLHAIVSDQGHAYLQSKIK